jgi:2-polyprenyl-3-methyl-5-hydroxy-6-metoxy-1,4-benzoquinol methylase
MTTDHADHTDHTERTSGTGSADAAACPACGAPGRLLHHVVQERYRLLRCTGCGTEFLRDPVPGGSTAGEYWEDYKFDVYAGDAVRVGYEQRYAAVFDRLEDRAGRCGQVLDVGCGIGNFLAWARDRGLDAVGSDVDERALAGAAARGLTVFTPEQLAAQDTEVDVVTLWDVIEHVADPGPFLTDALSRLRPGGWVLLETPDAAFPVRPLVRALHRATGGRVDLAKNMYYWEHKIYFTERGLERVLAPHGVTVVEVHRMTSPVAKMQATFDHGAEGSGPVDRLLARGWPAAEALFRRMGRGNKLVVLARRTG